MVAIITAVALAAMFVGSSPGQQSAQPIATPPRDVTTCDLVNNPQAFNNTRVRVTTFIEYEFENFTFSDPACSERQQGHIPVWVTFGGSRNSGAVYCCPGEGTLRQGTAPHPLVEDGTFQAFQALVARERDTLVRFTAVGTFLAKTPSEYPIKDMAGGYGHFGCCSLFVLERVESFDPHVRKDLDYSASLGPGEGRKPKCSMWQGADPSFRISSIDLDSNNREQAAGESGERPYVFDDPQRVALEALRSVSGETVKSIKRVRSSPGRQVFEWSPSKNQLTTIVVARPYGLSLAAHTSQVAWVTTRIVTTVCEK